MTTLASSNKLFFQNINYSVYVFVIEIRNHFQNKCLRGFCFVFDAKVNFNCCAVVVLSFLNLAGSHLVNEKDFANYVSYLDVF